MQQDLLEERLAALETEYAGDFSVCVVDLNHGDRFELRAGEPREMASTFKLCVLCELFRQAEARDIDLEAALPWKPEHHRVGDGVLRAMPARQSLTVHNMAVLMMIVSDNVATAAVVELVGPANVTRTMHEWGIVDTNIYGGLPTAAPAVEMQQPISTAADLCSLITRIYRHELLTATACEEIIRIMRAQRCNDMLPRFLPVGEDWGEAAKWIANKTGYGRCRVEVGIVHADARAFSLAIFFQPGEIVPASTKCLADYPPVLAMAHACRAVWDSFE